MYRMIIKIAWASIHRRRSRSYLVILMIALCLWGLLSLDGLYDGMIAQMINNAVRSDSGDITIFAKGYRQDRDLNKLIRDDNFLSILTDDQRVQGVSKRLIQDGLAATAHYARNIRIYGITLATEQDLSHLDSYITKGSYSFDRRQQGTIIGQNLADKLQLAIGSKIILTAQDITGEIASIALRVKGIIKTNTALDKNAVFMDLDRARQWLSVPQGISQIRIMLHNTKDAAAIQSKLQGINNIEIWRWDEMYPALLQGKEMMEIFNLVSSLVVFCVAGLGIFGVMTVSVLERLREFGIMLALGTEFRQVSGIVITESLFLGCLGFLAGASLGGGTLYYFHEHGLDLSIFSNALDTFGMDAVTYTVIRPGYFGLSLAAVIVASLLSAILPLRMLKKSKRLTNTTV